MSAHQFESRIKQHRPTKQSNPSPFKAKIRHYGNILLSNKIFCQIIRLNCAVGLAAFMAWLLNIQDSGWALITAVIVAQNNLTDTISKGHEQLFGMIFGATMAVISISLSYFFHWPLWLTFLMGFLPLTILVADKPAARLGIVTLMVVLLFPAENSPYLRAFERVFCIVIGVVSSTLVSYFVLHEQARRVAFYNAYLALKEIASMLREVQDTQVSWKHVQDLNDRCSSYLREVQHCVVEAQKEHWHPLKERDPMLYYLTEALRQLQMDALAVTRAILILPQTNTSQALERTRQARKDILEAFDLIIQRCSSEAQSYTEDKSIIAKEIHAVLPPVADKNEIITHFLVNLLLEDLKKMISLLCDHPSEAPIYTMHNALQ